MIRSLLSLLVVAWSTPYAFGYFHHLTHPTPELSVAFLTVWMYGLLYVAACFHAREVAALFEVKR